jgi:hypothetical protein
MKKKNCSERFHKEKIKMKPTSFKRNFCFKWVWSYCFVHLIVCLFIVSWNVMHSVKNVWSFCLSIWKWCMIQIVFFGGQVAICTWKGQNEQLSRFICHVYKPIVLNLLPLSKKFIKKHISDLIGRRMQLKNNSTHTLHLSF